MRRLSPLIVVVVLLVACGSSYSGLSKAEFVKQADAVCKRYDVKIRDAIRNVGANPTLAQAQDAYLKKLAPLVRSEVGELRGLKPPKADRATTAKVFGDLSHGIDQLVSSVPKTKTLSELGALAPSGVKDANAGAKKYGLKTCGQS